MIYNWATEVSQYIKSLDPRHMVALGDEGWFAPADGIGDGSYAYSGDQGYVVECAWPACRLLITVPKR